jgi:hypothetical protein
MHSEIVLRFGKDVQFALLSAGMPPTSPHQVVLQDTYFKNNPDVLAGVEYSRKESMAVYMVFRDSLNSIRIHVEGRSAKGNLSHLVTKSEEIAQRFIDAGRRSGYDVMTVTITLFADDFLITVGERSSFWKQIGTRLADTIFGDVVIGFLTFVLTGALTGRWREALVVGAASVLCFVLWLAIQVRARNANYEYKRF